MKMDFKTVIPSAISGIVNIVISLVVYISLNRKINTLNEKCENLINRVQLLERILSGQPDYSMNYQPPPQKQIKSSNVKNTCAMASNLSNVMNLVSSAMNSGEDQKSVLSKSINSESTPSSQLSSSIPSSTPSSSSAISSDISKELSELNNDTDEHDPPKECDP
jgi:hypothetical protein